MCSKQNAVKTEWVAGNGTSSRICRHEHDDGVVEQTKTTLCEILVGGPSSVVRIDGSKCLMLIGDTGREI